MHAAHEHGHVGLCQSMADYCNWPTTRCRDEQHRILGLPLHSRHHQQQRAKPSLLCFLKAERSRHWWTLRRSMKLLQKWELCDKARSSYHLLVICVALQKLVSYVEHQWLDSITRSTDAIRTLHNCAESVASVSNCYEVRGDRHEWDTTTELIELDAINIIQTQTLEVKKAKLDVQQEMLLAIYYGNLSDTVLQCPISLRMTQQEFCATLLLYRWAATTETVVSETPPPNWWSCSIRHGRRQFGRYPDTDPGSKKGEAICTAGDVVS